MIGIVGGVGPYAGIDLARKIFDNTIADSDQQHLPVSLISWPSEIGDRTAYLLGEEKSNPGEALARVVLHLEKIGVKVAGIPCNTAHSPRIWKRMEEELTQANCKVNVVHMIEETARFIKQNNPSIQVVGVLSTTGTQKTRVYPEIFSNFGISVLAPEDEEQNLIHEAIYSKKFGIKAFSNPVKPEVVSILRKAILDLQGRGAEAVVLGCTELPLAIKEREVEDIQVVDPTEILARALIRETFPEKLKPMRDVIEEVS